MTLFSDSGGWQRLGEYTLGRRLRYENPVANMEISDFLLPAGCRTQDLLFFDTETTGLSGGAGTSIFLIAMAWIEGDNLEVEQLFLEDFPGEGEFLEAIGRRLGRHRVFVSYNGRAFDAHILRTRFLLNRMELALELQTDLLYWARRLWRRALPDCSLGTIEREILGIRRQADVPGFEVPGIYLRYLRDGLDDRLELVLEHNLQDVLSLGRLFSTIDGILKSREGEEGSTGPHGRTTAAGNPAAAGSTAVGGSTTADGSITADNNKAAHDNNAAAAKVDRRALGNFVLTRDERWGVRLLEESFRSGDEAAGRSLSLFHKRRGDWQRAVSLWLQLIDNGKSMFAGIELAKYFEHRKRDPQQALFWVQTMFSWHLPLDLQARSRLNHRRARLLRKIERAESGRQPHQSLK